MPQYFKNSDDTEKKFYNAGESIVSQIEGQRDLFFDECFDCFILGELLYDNDLAPLSNAIPRDIFRESFSVVFDAFTVAGSFESYLTVFRKVFGDTVVVAFTVPGPGQLNIAISAATVEVSDFVARYITDNEYIFDTVLTQAGDTIQFQTVKGFQSQYDLEQMLFEMVPDGIYTQITLTLGG